MYACVLRSYSPQLCSKGGSPVRGMLSIFLVGASTMYILIPLLQVAVLEGSDEALTQVNLWGPEFGWWTFGFIAFYLLYPERFEGETFSFVGNSHNIFHLVVLACTTMHFSTLTRLRFWMID